MAAGRSYLLYKRCASKSTPLKPLARHNANACAPPREEAVQSRVPGLQPYNLTSNDMQDATYSAKILATSCGGWGIGRKRRAESWKEFRHCLYCGRFMYPLAMWASMSASEASGWATSGGWQLCCSCQDCRRFWYACAHASSTADDFSPEAARNPGGMSAVRASLL